MFDIDGTLVESTAFDDACYRDAIAQVLNVEIGNDWSIFKNITDTGLLQEILEANAIKTPINEILNEVKQHFFFTSQQYLEANGLKQIKGAGVFLDRLKVHDNIQLAIATGGWQISAEMKLRAAGIKFEDIPFANSDDHFTRIGIMQKAVEKTQQSTFNSKTYFGDGVWDKKACEELNYDFIAIGNKVDHAVRYNDFSEIDFDLFIQSL